MLYIIHIPIKVNTFAKINMMYGYDGLVRVFKTILFLL